MSDNKKPTLKEALTQPIAELRAALDSDDLNEATQRRLVRDAISEIGATIQGYGPHAAEFEDLQRAMEIDSLLARMTIQ